MRKEEFEALGIEKSLAEKAAEASKKELEGYVSKEKYDAEQQKCTQLESTVSDYEEQLDTLKAAAGNNEELKQQITTLQEQNKQKDADYKKELDALKMTNAIKMAIAATAQDSDLVAGLVDRNKLILSDDGKITGLDEQLKTIKESKPFLFKQEEPKPSGKKGFFPLGPKEKGGEGEKGQVSMKEAIAARLNLGTEGKGE
ncbi:phage scaffolding protein [Anaerobutyricum soehngenii]|uniref:phage scaffolding protein n=1 Tax=Anaerobutyricum soehngenii TaxID=105843 RepID=UPI001C10C492|nr:phage scaffolding protein [Anaerobutyricum soehngenii]MBU5416529.1 phage scaffolding protein [Anaerobutyricum soehngenii]